MARTTLNNQQIGRTGLEPVYVAVNGADGNQFQNDGRMFLDVKNDDIASKTITVPTQSTVDGLAVADQVITIPAGEKRMIGPFPPNIYNVDGYVQVNYSAGTSVTAAVLRL